METHKLNVRVSTFSFPSGSRADLHKRPGGPSLRMEWMDGMGWDGWDGISKVSCIFLYTLWVSRNIPTYIYTVRITISPPPLV